MSILYYLVFYFGEYSNIRKWRENKGGFIHLLVLFVLISFWAIAVINLTIPKVFCLTTEQKIPLPENYTILEVGTYNFGGPFITVENDSELLDPSENYFITIKNSEYWPPSVWATTVSQGVVLQTKLLEAERPEIVDPKPFSMLGRYFLSPIDQVKIEGDKFVSIWVYENWLVLALTVILLYLIRYLYDVFLLKKIHKLIFKREYQT
jgi:hypothetical protein